MNIVVTGALGAIGYGISEHFSSRGDSLVLLDQAPTDSKPASSKVEALRALGAESVVAHSVDLRDLSRVEDLLTAIKKQSTVDVVINCAGMQHVAELPSQTLEVWLDIVSVNLTASFLTTKFFLPGMCEQGFGRIINVASVHGLVASEQKGPYVSSKHGLLGLTKVTALEAAAFGDAASGGVTANAICPGWVDTPLLKAQTASIASAMDVDTDQALQKMLDAKHPSRRLTRVADLVHVVDFLCDVRSHNITGAAIPIDGGWTCQ